MLNIKGQVYRLAGRCSYLASHLLGRIAKVLPVDWERIYNHSIYFLETFVDTERFKGTCYRAANWIYLGKTTGLQFGLFLPNRFVKLKL